MSSSSSVRSNEIHQLHHYMYDMEQDSNESNSARPYDMHYDTNHTNRNHVTISVKHSGVPFSKPIVKSHTNHHHHHSNAKPSYLVSPSANNHRRSSRGSGHFNFKSASPLPSPGPGKNPSLKNIP